MEKVSKVWGEEHHIINNEKYCLKYLYLSKFHRCSFHFHPIKDETFYVLTGKVILMYSETETEISKAKKTCLLPGQLFHVPPGMKHSFFGLEDSIIMEVSTHDCPEDSIRYDTSQ